MTKEGKRAEALGSTITDEKTGVHVNAPPPNLAAIAGKVDPASGKITFGMYMKARAIPLQRQAGMAAWAREKNVSSATFEEWNDLFRKY